MSRRDGYVFDQHGYCDNHSSPESGTNSAKLASAEREIKRLQEENKKLKQDLTETSLLYKQLLHEESQEKFDERRVNILKAQLLQLERQVLSMSEALSSRTQMIMEVENAVSTVADLCRAYMNAEGAIGEVKVKRKDLHAIVEKAESARIKLYKNIEVSPEKLARPIMMMNQHVSSTYRERVTWLDVCSGRLDHLNLKQVGKLESELVGLYKTLLSLQQCMAPLVVPGGTTINREVPEEVYHRLAVQTESCCGLLHRATHSLLQLSLLLPSAPWPKLQKFAFETATVNDVMKHLPGFQKSRAADVRITLEAVLRGTAYEKMMLSQEIKMLKQELAFHNSVYQLQQSYMQTMFSVLCDSLSNFEQEVWEVLCKPLEEIMKSYEYLEETANEEALKKFLSLFKQHKCQVSEVLEKLKIGLPKKEGTDALSEFGKKFFDKIATSQVEAMQSRDKLVAELEDVKTQKAEALRHLEAILASQSHANENEPLRERNQDNHKPNNVELSANTEERNVKRKPPMYKKNSLKEKLEESDNLISDASTKKEGTKKVMRNVNLHKASSLDGSYESGREETREEKTSDIKVHTKRKSSIPSSIPSPGSPVVRSPSSRPSSLPRSSSLNRLVLKKSTVPSSSPNGVSPVPKQGEESEASPAPASSTLQTSLSGSMKSLGPKPWK